MKITILGCGSSLGVPALCYGWGNCDPNNEKNRRTRSSIFIEHNNTRLLVDASPDLKEQILANDIKTIDAILLTHSHFDHAHGFNELRPMMFHQNKVVDIFSTSETIKNVHRSFFYLFQNESQHIYRKYLNLKEIEFGNFAIQNINGICFPQNHGFSTSLGFRIENFAYSTDVVELSNQMIENLQNLDLWIVDCLCIGQARATHANLETVLKWIEIIKPKQALLTHMDSSMDYDYLCEILPKNIRPAFDQMQIEI